MNENFRKIQTLLGHILAILYVFLMLKQFYRPDLPMMIIPFHVFATLGLVFLFVPLKIKNHQNKFTFIFDILAFLICVYFMVYYWIHAERMQLRFDGVDPVFIGETLTFWIGIPLLLEGVRRSTGWALVCVVLVVLIYGFGAIKIPGSFYFSGFSIKNYIEITALGTEGLFGVAANAMVTMVFYFVFFGVIFSVTGGGDIFIDLSLLASGRFVGGAAKTAVIASALFGTISGSAVANVTSTGVLTIPLMKRTGYTPEQAAATEAVASTGGQLMPPIMGVAAFVMADLLGIPYIKIATAGLIPAIGYYIAIFISVDLLARKTGIGSIDYKELKMSIKPLKPRIHLLLAPIMIILSLFLGLSVSSAALIGTGIGLITPLFQSNTRYTLKNLYSMIIDTGKQMGKISVAVSAVGVIIAVSIQSGIAIKFVSLLASIGTGNLILSLFLVIAGCLILGMGLPTVAAYIIAAVIFVPALTNLGISPLASHFFVLYYSVLSMVTPPVCLAAYAGAGLANANPSKTGFTAFKLALVIFFLPFGFVRDAALLGDGNIITIIIACIGILLATISWSIALQGWFGKKLNWAIRVIYTIICIAIVFEPTYSIIWIIGVITFICLSSGILLYSKFLNKKINI